jgi:MoxR-like ATPase
MHLFRGRTFAIEDDVQDIAFPVLDHRLIYKNKEAKQSALKQIITKEVERLAKLKLF